MFDFDGTLSLIRTGWRDVMVTMMVNILERLDIHHDQYAIRGIVCQFVDNLTGEQTIYQMIRLADEVRLRGGIPLEPRAYKEVYNDELMSKIRFRLAELSSHAVSPETYLVSGSREMLTTLSTNDVKCYLASGTDELDVVREATLLDIAKYFCRICGARDDYERADKRIVVKEIVSEAKFGADEFVCFGDGYVEIESAKDVGGIAVGVASNEHVRGMIDEHKRTRLIRAGADIIVPDFEDHKVLFELLFENG
jgi:phosphoglycolate phosphatase